MGIHLHFGRISVNVSSSCTVRKIALSVPKKIYMTKENQKDKKPGKKDEIHVCSIELNDIHSIGESPRQGAFD